MAPLATPLSTQKIRLISVVGTGILIGTALVVIIPEGADTLYTSPVGATRSEVGLALLAGFLLMYLVDKLPALIRQAQSGASNFIPLSVDMSSFRNSIFGQSGSNIQVQASPAGNAHNGQSEDQSSHDSVKSTSVGLIIHAAADGIALGASVATENSALEAIVFIAIMVHKAPAAFGLAAVLLQAGGPARAKKTLGIFAAAAPVGAILTYILIKLLGSSDLGLIHWWTGILLLFSGGTFLYVAVHVMQEGGEADSVSELLLSVTGMMIPVLTLFVHGD